MTAKPSIAWPLFYAAFIAIIALSFNLACAIDDRRVLRQSLATSTRLLLAKSKQVGELKSELAAAHRFIADWKGGRP